MIIRAGLFLFVRTEAQIILFDFDSAPVHDGLPPGQTVGGITGHLSATGHGFQRFHPAGNNLLT
ncbi:MAG TPA: hypothetical protein VJT54_10440 [Verrucomicrobiae bacterium]|nr:hypothetical protein [Verrucomicrobiae bacterium]